MPLEMFGVMSFAEPPVLGPSNIKTLPKVKLGDLA